MGSRWWVVAAAFAASVGQSHAGTLICHFTEPFFTITYDSRTGTVVRTSFDVADPDTGKPIPEILAEGATLRAVPSDDYRRKLKLEKGSETILDLKLTGQGSDGMSESLYPFEAMYGVRDGGCSTDKYPSYDIHDLLEDIGAPS